MEYIKDNQDKIMKNLENYNNKTCFSNTKNTSESTEMKNSSSDYSLSNNETIDDYSIEDFEEMIEELINGSKTLKDLPAYFGNYISKIDKLPHIPNKPESWECCGSGCSPCIMDTYYRDLEIHQRAVYNLSLLVHENTEV
jgi:hypothetical protein